MAKSRVLSSIHRIWTKSIWRMRGLKVFALVGKSGTGKSFRAGLIAEKYKIEAIIDDGLLIENSRIVAGRSAKKEKAYLSAVKTALFTDREHLREVKHRLEQSHVKKILILGTSTKMIFKICRTLQLPPPVKIIQIEDIATADEIETAIHYRKNHGKHVIPVPAIEVKRNYPRIMADSVKILFRRGLGVFGKQREIEKTVVRPEFSRKGAVSISEAALSQMIIHCILEKAADVKLKKLTVKQDKGGYHLHVGLSVPFGFELATNLHSLHDYIIDRIEKYTGIIIEDLHINIESVGEPQTEP
jgi:adenylate kinase family enzyme